jgi:hypothetical protein
MLTKLVKVAFVWIVIALIFPVIKDYYDTFTAPITGLLITGADDWTLAIMTGIPWLVPLIVFVMSIIYILKPEEPKIPQIGKINFPR